MGVIDALIMKENAVVHNNSERQRGAILVLTVLFLIILLAASALVIDVGRIYLLRTQMQNAADAAALAAAYELNGETDARERAIKAASQLLSHQGPFSSRDDKDLLKHLENYYYPDNPDDSTFIFYSWIGSEYDPTTAPCGTNTTPDGKCLASEGADAQYVKIRLEPLLTDEEGDYGVDFYFAPALAIFLAGDPIMQGSTTVGAVAGNTDSFFCDLPPLMICEPPGGFETVVSQGDQIILKTQGGPSATWLPGDFAFLEPTQCNANDPDCTDINQLNKALAAQLAQERDIGCSPSIIVPLPGDRQAAAYAVNTRLGLYGKVGGVDYSDEEFPSSSNVVDYPRDQTFDASNRFGNGDWNRTAYFNDYHGGATPPIPNISRFQTYYWEQHGIPDDWDAIYHNLWENELVADLSGANVSLPDKAESLPDFEQCQQSPVPEAWDHPDNRGCLNLDGDPRELQSYTPPLPVNGVDYDKPNRRVWFVAALNCADYEDDINNRKPFNPLDGDGGDFYKFFITEHVKKGPPTELIAEYLGPVLQEEEKNIVIHNVIQLYE